jgi:hypothetical protein
MKIIQTYNNFINEKFNLDDIKIQLENSNDDIISKIKLNFNILIKKNKEKNIRLLSISGFLHDNVYKNLKYKIILKFNNKDEIVGILNKYNIIIIINDKIVYDIDNDKFNIDSLIDKMSDEYKKYLKNNNYKII